MKNTYIGSRPGLLAKKLVSLLLQGMVLAAVLGVAYILFATTQENLEIRGIESGFAFLWREAGLPIGDSLIEYDPSRSYGYAFLVGVLNTLLVSALAIVFATILGVMVGVARVSNNWLLAKCAAIYVETLRNLPLLLTLFFVYSVVLASLPHPREAIVLAEGYFLSKRGVYLPRPVAEEGFGIFVAAVCIALLLAVIFWRWAGAYKRRTGTSVPGFWGGLAIFGTLATLAYLASNSPIGSELPVYKGFNFKGGLALKPEFAALLIGLILYTAAFIGENVRSGIQSVQAGQIEAANALGVSRGVVTRLVLLPQALRVTIPATTNDYASLVKNSSLAVAIGYPDMVSIGGTIIGQNGQAIEIIAMWMAVYLTINLIISLVMNVLNARVQVVER
ncbi:amino acid ABC transporter permease [Nitratireductor pacificus]|uniref:Amino acid ABC transporter permease n=1 Tax=Nitratireductor pacificus pht-3B TaxID=391937 RepID=K2LR43_9HYPH|nr:ABC transporter permease subunit [Nitratireductor pacificus]EKF20179.1 amino acid ABC transporter permease [Nitratireductor pacificus pht-3B]